MACLENLSILEMLIRFLRILKTTHRSVYLLGFYVIFQLLRGCLVFKMHFLLRSLNVRQCVDSGNVALLSGFENFLIIAIPFFCVTIVNEIRRFNSLYVFNCMVHFLRIRQSCHKDWSWKCLKRISFFGISILGKICGLTSDIYVKVSSLYYFSADCIT